MLHVNVDHYHTTNRTATTDGPISLARAAGLEKYVYGNGFTVMERISGTLLLKCHINRTYFKSHFYLTEVIGPTKTIS